MRNIWTRTLLALLGGAMVATGTRIALAARPSAHPTHIGVCQVGSLAAPGDPGYGPYSADYYSTQFSYSLSKPVHVTFATYTLLNDMAPRIASYEVLDSNYAPVGTYALVITGCQQNNPAAATSMFTYDATWTTPATPDKRGVYYLAVSFVFADGTLVEYFANISVRPVPLVMTGGSIHWETTLTGIGYQQASAAYNLFSPGVSDVVTARTSFYFDANPAAVCAQASCPPGSDSTTFIQGGMDNNLEGASVFALETPPHVPFYKDGWGRQSRAFAFTQNLGGTSMSDSGAVFVEYGSYTIGRHTYRYHVEINETFYLRSGGITVVHIGSYVLDNGITGPVGWQGSADNLGEGQGVRFYANPPAPEPPTTAITTAGAVASVTLSHYDVAPSGAVELPNGGTMAWQYAIHLYRAVCASITTLSSCTIGSEVAGSPHRTTATTDTWLNLPAGTTAPGDCYWPQLRVNYTVKGQLHLSSDDVPSSFSNIFCIAQRVAPPAQTPTPGPTETSTPLPPTATATALPPTATSTPALGTALLVQTVVPYAWVRTYHDEDAAAQDRLYASTWQANPDPATLFWPVGRPLHLLPAVDENPAEAHLIIDDLGNGASATLYPASVTATEYTVLDAGALGLSHCLPAGNIAAAIPYAHDPRYPAAIDPFSRRIAIVWAQAGLAGTRPSNTIRCDPAPLLEAASPGPATLLYRVHERLVFMARFAAVAPAVGTVIDCAADLTLLPSAAPFSAEPGVPAPAPAFTSALAPAGPCPGGDVGLGTARYALDHWQTELHMTDAGGAITGASYTVAGTLLRLTVTVERVVALHYHLVVSREVLP